MLAILLLALAFTPHVAAKPDTSVDPHLANVVATALKLKPEPQPKDMTANFSKMVAERAAEAKAGAGMQALLMQQAQEAQVAQQQAVVVSGTGYSSLGQQLATQRGWTGLEWSDLYNLINGESGWRTTALNASSGACGIGQDINGCEVGSDPTAQINWAYDYIVRRYGDPIAAWGHELSIGWY